MKSAVTISLAPEAKGGPFTFWDLAEGCSHAAKLGFDAVEIFPSSANLLNRRELNDLLAKHNLKIAAVGTGAGWVKHKLRLTDPDAEIRRRAREFAGGIVALAGELGAPAIIGSMQGRCEAGVSREQALEWFGEGLKELSDKAARFSQVLLYEPLNRYETDIFNRQGEAADFLRALPSKNIRLLCDLYHMNIEERNVAEALREAGPLVGHIHWADSNRKAMGLGHTDAGPVIAALRAIGYSGYLSAEVAGGYESAEQSIKSIRRALSSTDKHA
ncbi:MAG TPA: sugar phosphate isomerase/epimerase family protein [Verrucomicrobiae bacterium]|jgi:sugar phosphate isomerase/epimerase